MRALAPAIVLIAIAALAVPAGASARIPIRVGIGDQSAAMFDQPLFQQTKFKRVRYLVPWNVMDDASVRLTARAYVQRARAARMDLLIHVSTDNYTIKQAHL